MNDITKERVAYIDIAKGICIILVVAGHMIICGYALPHGNALNDLIYSFHMPAFFALSGMVAHHRGKTSVLRMIRRRIAPYLLWSVVYMCLLANTAPDLDRIEQIAAIVTLRGRSPLWFLPALLLTELIYMQFVEGKRRALLLCWFIGLFLLCSAAGKWWSTVIDGSGNVFQRYLLTTFFRIFPCSAFYAAGPLLKNILDRIKTGQALIMGLLSAAMLFLSYRLFHNTLQLHTCELGSIPMLAMVNGLLGTAAVLSIAWLIMNMRPAVIFQFVGTYSLGIMILHSNPPMPTMKMADMICRALHLHGNQIALYVGVLCGIIFISITVTCLARRYALFLGKTIQ